MVVERLLLEIENKFKFDMSFDDVRILYQHLKDIGRITNLFFALQEEYYDKFKDKDKLKEYHDKLLNEDINIDITDAAKFIEWIANTNLDNDFRDVVEKNKFW